MRLSKGQRLAHFEIRAPIGAGGMGEVYAAKDTRLDRTVAIKIVPDHLSKDPARRQRFEREAKAISALQHPHIATLYDVGSENGIDFLVMEYLEGETLAERLTRGPLSLEEALRYGSQIADALGEAHGKDIVHRDLKPGNIMLTTSGVKLLDFGLAKIQRDEGSVGVDSSSPTLHKPLTEEGTLLGTVPYMAPEQLEAKEADARADIFAFGVVLYEMVAGRRAFAGESQASLIAAIMSGEPRPIGELQPQSPPLLERILSKCLAKAPDERFQSARDLKGALDWAAEPLERAQPAPAAGRSRERIAWLMALLAITAFATFFPRNRAPEPMALTLRTVLNLPESQALQQQTGVPFDISPDGQRLAFTSFDPTKGWGQLFVRDMGSFEPRPLTEPTISIQQSFFSPDGRHVGFVSGARNLIYKVSVDGGAPAEIARLNTPPKGLTWLDDGSIVFGTSSGLWHVSREGATPEPLTRLKDGENHHRTPHRLPNGRGVVFSVATGSVAVAVLPAGATEHRVLTVGESTFYAPSGHLIFVSPDSRLMTAPFDLDTLEITGTPVPTTDRVDRGDAALLTVSANGTVVYAQGMDRPATTVWANRKGEVTPVLDEYFHTVRLSADGTRFVADNEIGGRVWIHDLTRGTRVLLTEGAQPILPQWSPDGTEVVYGLGDGNIYVKFSDGSGDARLFLERADTQQPLSWSPDGRFLAITEFSPTRGRDILIVSSEGELIPFADTRANENGAAFSPDGKWIAYQSDETGRPEIYVKPFPGPGARVPISSNRGMAPVWSRDGRELFYREGTAMMAVAVSTEPTFNAERPEFLFDGSFSTDGTGHPSYDVSLDGERFLMMHRESQQLTQLHVIVNLADELEALER